MEQLVLEKALEITQTKYKDAPINPGNSGGTIINENGNLIAIAVSGLSKDQTGGIIFDI